MPGSLRAGGFPVHRTRHANGAAAQESQRHEDTVPIFERYQDLAAATHRTAVAPVGDRWVWACVCGKAEKVNEPGLRNADMAAMKHVLDEATKLHDRLEGPTLDDDDRNPG